ncbi:alpha-L-fucosidase [Sphingobacterium sp. DN00404]|uniref:alpha-L-fucosidase n=1 Tax=Sphingobacterium micropteri TaxID=2763501 RepID=A0ABR7YPB1_9SPHI|nr:alpha-L-fucosidase [Sphingobacterium micropteri]MBD1433151.1 alpha-L-fucosidase [Sphingobacterium micropteri]
MKKSRLLLLSFILPVTACMQEVAEPEPYGVLPTERQLRWHEMEMYSLIHYTPTTFQNKEWGFGDADPQIFNPQHFDAQQIAAAAASAGFKGLISVAKHHDGFCLWPTETTNYSIAASPWKDGKGDMVKEFMQATHDQGMKFGVYLSAWDRNDTRYGSPAYAEAYREQLMELMTQYGELFTSWHDGANGGDGYYGGKNEKRIIDRTTYYEWHEKTWPIVREKQPMAMIFSDVGPDMRWVGNEKGFAAETSWATYTPRGIDGGPALPGASDYSESETGTRHGEHWIPAECDVPHRPGWFYHPDQDSQVKTPDELFEIYLKSVGRGANMNLGLAPMPAGYLHANDVKSLGAFGRKVEKTFETNLAEGAQVKASNVRGNSNKFETKWILDNDRYTYYASDDDVLEPELEVTLTSEQEFDIIRLRENIKLGQRLDSVSVSIFHDKEWVPLASATSIGANRLIYLDKPVKATKLKMKLYAPVAPTLSDFGLFKEFKEPFTFGEDVKDGQMALTANDFTIRTGNGLSKSIDNDPTTFETLSEIGDGVVFELKKIVSAIGYLPRQDGQKEGIALKYEIATSADGKNWKNMKTGEFSNIQANPIEQIIALDTPIQDKYIRFVPVETVGKTFSVASFTLFGK